MPAIIERPRVHGPNPRVVHALQRARVVVLGLGIVVVPQWFWAFGPMGDITQARIIVMGFFVVTVSVLSLVLIAYQRSLGRLSVARARVHVFMGVPLALAVLVWALQGRTIPQLLGYGGQWYETVLPIGLVTVWYFVLYGGLVSTPPRSRKYESYPSVLSSVVALSLFLYSIFQVRSWHDIDFSSFSWVFIMVSFVAIGLAWLRPSSARASSFELRGGARVVVAICALVVCIGGYWGEIRVARAHYAFAHSDFQRARIYNPYNPEYTLAWAEHELAGLNDQYVADNLAESKQRVGAVVDALANVRGVQDPALLLRTARLYVNMQRFVEGAAHLAQPFYQALAHRYPRDTGILTEVARFDRTQLKDNARSERLLNAAITIDPSYGPAIVEKALLLDLEGKSDDALDFLRQRKLVDTQVYYQYARLAYNKGNLLEAKDAFLAIVKSDPLYADAHYSLGVYYYRAGEFALALNEFQIVAKLNPESPDIQKKIQEVSAHESH